MEEKEFLQKAAIASISYFVSMIAFYLDIGQNMGNYWLNAIIPMIFCLILIQYSTKKYIFTKFMIPNLLSGLLWSSAFPILYVWTYEKAWFMSLTYYDFVIGASIFLFLTSLEVILNWKISKKKSSAIMAALNFIFILIPFIEYAYYFMTWHCLSPASLMALYLTNWKESIDFLRGNVGDINLIIIFVVTGFLLKKSYEIHKKFAEEIKKLPKKNYEKISAIIVVVCSSLALIYYPPQSSIATLWKNVTDYVEKMQEYNVGHAERYENLQIDEKNTLAAKTTGTVIIVIGESASRSYMKAFNEKFEFEDTPILSAKKIEGFEKNGFIIYENIYSSWSQTVPSLQRALTEQSQYNEKEFEKSVSIIDVAKKSGYKTYWFSNQGRYGEYDSAITLVAKTAEISEWTDDAYDFSDKYDSALLKYLEKVDGRENNFIVLHLMGSHIYYNNRYPKEFKKWTTKDGTGMATAAPSYANSILYTDYILNEIYEYAKKNLNLEAMIYFSDHGENLNISHNPDVFSFDMVRIPMFVYLSEEYREKLPERTENLRRNEKKYFTNDMLYDTICGIINAPSNKYEVRQDFSSEGYNFNRENLTTMLGQHSLKEDVDQN